MIQDNASFTFLHRIEEVELNIEDGRWQSALALALTLPDICGGIAFPEIVKRYRDGRAVLDFIKASQDEQSNATIAIMCSNSAYGNGLKLALQRLSKNILVFETPEAARKNLARKAYALGCYGSSDKTAGSAVAGGQKNTRDSSIQSTGIRNNDRKECR